MFPPTRHGFGSTIMEQLIRFEVDVMSTPGFPPSGFVLEVELPAAVAQCEPMKGTTISASPANDVNVDASSLAALLHTSLVVEDNLFIALDVEDMLRKMGASRVDIAKSVAEALALKAERNYSFALLDINLGTGNSLPIARTRFARGAPFVFGTGYGRFSLVGRGHGLRSDRVETLPSRHPGGGPVAIGCSPKVSAR